MRTALALVALAGTAHADTGDRWDGGTMLRQLVYGVGGAVTGGAAGGLVGGIVGIVQSNGEGDPYRAAGLGMAAGILVGEVVGVTYEGDQLHSSGKWWGATAGAWVGTALFAGLAYGAIRADLDPGPLVGSLVGAVLIFGGTIAGYQLTAHAHPAVTMRLAAFTF